MRQRRLEERMQEERIVYARLHALTGNFIVVYVVDPETNHYREFSATDNYVESFAQAKEGEEFFDKVREVARLYNHPDDLNRFFTAFTKENIMAEVERNGIFTFGYRLMMEGEPRYVQMKAAMAEEKEGPRLIVGLNDIDTQVRQEEEFEKLLEQAQAEANIDALTRVKNKHAYLEAEKHIDRLIADHRQPPFAVVILDVNDLKKINDTSGHQAGDRYLRDACEVICDIFKRSPVYRIGGDEFAVISQGKDYAHIEELIGEVRNHNEEASRNDGIIIAFGMSRFEDDECVAAVFERADRNMYEIKKALKSSSN
jgi:diguanylate cyclase (GGDEF)-like protein